MKRIPSFLYCFLLSSLIIAQQNVHPDPDQWLVPKEGVPKVLLVGTWHFAYPGLDAHKTSEANRMNIFSEKRQKELSDLLDYLMHFQATKIVVERSAYHNLSARYQAWKEGKRKLSASETEQIGMRLMDRLQLDTLYGADAGNLLRELFRYRDPDQAEGYVDRLAKGHYYGGEDEISERYNQYYDAQDKYSVDHTLLESFQYFNSEKVLNRDFGAYLAGGHFNESQHQGPDALSAIWINRNLRIFKNIQRIIDSPQDRVLVIFGAGHVALLDYFFKCSPEFELVPFNSLKK